MFQNKTTFYNFIRNVAECTAENGYFIATTYDGKQVFNMLRRLQMGQQVEKYLGDKKIWSIQKNYDNATFEDNETSLGYQINVYQDSINKTIPEYLVNDEFLIRTMEKYGFALISKEDCRKFNIKYPSSSFRYLYNQFMLEIDEKLKMRMNKEVEKDYGKSYMMTDEEKDISFLNTYFIFKKVVTRDVALLTETLISGTSYEGEEMILQKEQINDTIQQVREIISKPEKEDGIESKGIEGEEEEEEISFKRKKSKTSKEPSVKEKEPSVKEKESSKKSKSKKEEIEEEIASESKKTTKKTSRKSDREEKSEKSKTRKKRESTIQSIEEMKKKRSQSEEED